MQREFADANVTVTFWPMRVPLLEARIAAATNDNETAAKTSRETMPIFKGNASVEPDVLAARSYLASRSLR